MKTIKEDLVDIAELLSDNPMVQNRMWEQEVYFDAGYTPPQTEFKTVKVEWIDGKKYNVYS